jgi:hypothetical protein
VILLAGTSMFFSSSHVLLLYLCSNVHFVKWYLKVLVNFFLQLVTGSFSWLMVLKPCGHLRLSALIALRVSFQIIKASTSNGKKIRASRSCIEFVTACGSCLHDVSIMAGEDEKQDFGKHVVCFMKVVGECGRK